LPAEMGDNILHFPVYSGYKIDLHNSESNLRQKLQYKQELLRWWSAFSLLNQKTQQSNDLRSINAAHILVVIFRSIDLKLIRVVNADHNCFDQHLPTFREITLLSRKIIKARKACNQADFSLELGIVPSLTLTARSCPDRELRAEAISLLRWYGVREGICDSSLMAAIASCSIDLKEDGNVVDPNRESGRVVISTMKLDQMRRRVTLVYTRSPPSTAQSSEEITVKW